MKKIYKAKGNSAYVTIPSGETIEFKPYSYNEDGSNSNLMAEINGEKYKIDNIPTYPIILIYKKDISENRYDSFIPVYEFYPFIIKYNGFKITVEKEN